MTAVPLEGNHDQPHDQDSPLVESGKIMAVLAITAGGIWLLSNGLIASYEALLAFATKLHIPEAPRVALGFEASLVVVVAWDIVLTWCKRPGPLLRWVARILTVLSVVVNAAAGWPDIRAMMMYLPAPIGILAIVETVRHVLLARHRDREPIPFARWRHHYTSSRRLQKLMVRWEIASYRQALDMEQRIEHAKKLMEVVYGDRWRVQAGADLAWMLDEGAMLDVALPRVYRIAVEHGLDVPGGIGTETGTAHGAQPPAGKRDTGTAHPATETGSTEDAAPTGTAASASDTGVATPAGTAPVLPTRPAGTETGTATPATGTSPVPIPAPAGTGPARPAVPATPKTGTAPSTGAPGLTGTAPIPVPAAATDTGTAVRSLAHLKERDRQEIQQVMAALPGKVPTLDYLRKERGMGTTRASRIREAIQAIVDGTAATPVPAAETSAADTGHETTPGIAETAMPVPAAPTSTAPETGTEVANGTGNTDAETPTGTAETAAPVPPTPTGTETGTGHETETGITTRLLGDRTVLLKTAP